VLAALFCYLVYKRQWVPLAFIALAVLITINLTTYLKLNIHSPRPFFPLVYNSFLSGHMMRASLWSGILLLLSQLKIINLSQPYRLVLFIIPFLVGLTRIILGKHWLTDIISSYFLTLGILTIAGYFIQQVTNKYPTNLK